jgi:nucleotide-binding universal stress UspA family protein
MPIRTILHMLLDDASAAERLTVARAMAERFEASLVALHVTPPALIAVGLAEGAAYIGPELYEVHAAAAARVTERLKQVYRSVCEPPKVPCRWRHENGEPGSVAVGLARTADLTVSGLEASSGLDALAPSLAEQLALGAGGPVLLLPQSWTDAGMGRKILLAWNGSREAARALHDALPFMAGAEMVTVAAFGEELGHGLSDVVAMLAGHGVKAMARTEADTSDVGGQLIGLAAALDADLMVLGAYGRPRLREVVLGGVTRDILRGARVPVLLSS